jgi:hypothetical protein
MQSIQLNSKVQVNLDELVLSISQLDQLALKQFFEKLNQQLLQVEPPIPPFKQEILLLKQIKEMIPRSVVRRFKELQKKQYEQPLSPPEQREIKVLIDFIENKSAERVYLLGALAELRQIPITELAKQLKLKHFHG